MIQLSLYKLKPTIKYFAYLWLQLKKSLAVDNFKCLLKVATYFYLYIIVCALLVCLHTLPELLPKKDTKSKVWCHFGLRHEAN